MISMKIRPLRVPVGRRVVSSCCRDSAVEIAPSGSDLPDEHACVMCTLLQTVTGHLCYRIIAM